MASDQCRALPKFGEWDVNNPATSEGFTVIFNKARNQKANGAAVNLIPPQKTDPNYKTQNYPNKRYWLCCGGV